MYTKCALASSQESRQQSTPHIPARCMHGLDYVHNVCQSGMPVRELDNRAHHSTYMADACLSDGARHAAARQLLRGLGCPAMPAPCHPSLRDQSKSWLLGRWARWSTIRKRTARPATGSGCPRRPSSRRLSPSQTSPSGTQWLLLGAGFLVFSCGCRLRLAHHLALPACAHGSPHVKLQLVPGVGTCQAVARLTQPAHECKPSPLHSMGLGWQIAGRHACV